MVLTRSLLLLIAITLAKAQDSYSRDGPGYDSYYRGGRVSNPDEGLNDVIYGDEIPGEPGIDYPVLTEVPRTGFNCGLQPFPGYYADPAARCQAFYVCTGSGRGTGFLCPNGTIFNQESLVCDWWYNFDCSTAVSLYGVNAEIARAMTAVDAARARGLGVLPPGSYSAGRFTGAGGRAFGFGRPGALGGRRRPLTTPGRTPRPVYGPPAAGGNRNNVAGGGRNDFGRGYNNAPSPVYGAPGSNYNQYNNGPSPAYGAPGSNYNQNNGPSPAYGAPGNNYNQNNGPSPAYGAPGNNYNQYNDGYNNYNKPSNFDNSFSGGSGFGGQSSSYRPPSSGGYERPAGQQGTSSPDRQYLPPY